jgi:4-cresol dehydrogenase (hydroxylating)
MSPDAFPSESDPEAAAYFRALLDKAARIRMPELFAAPPAGALYHLRDRHGVSVVAVRTTELSHEQLIQIMTYRLAQYVVLDYVNKRMVYEARLEHESLENLDPDDVHVLAGAAESGEILCYMVIKAAPKASPGTTMRTRERPLFPIEQIFGWGVYNRLRILPDLPIARVRELERFVKNQQRETMDELAARAPVELLLGVLRVVTDPLASEIEACLGDIEHGVKAIKMFDFFHVPNLIVHGVVPYVAPGSYPYPSYQNQTRYPSTLLRSDISLERLDAIEKALDRPGKQGLAELFKLKADKCVDRSSLEPAGGLAPLTDAPLSQAGLPMEARRDLRELGEWLRTTDAFRSLSSAEAAVLATFLERRAAFAGDVLVRQGDVGDDLFLIEAGRAEVRAGAEREQKLTVAALGPGSYFGEIALVAGGERTADVVAVEPMSLLRLSKEAYSRYLAQVAEVEQQLTSTALTRSRETSRRTRPEGRPGSELARRFREILPPEAVLDDEAVIDERYRRNVTALSRKVPLVLRPGGEDEVRRIVSLANAERIALYPFSTGRNWGLGSKLPVVDGCVVVDLSRMDRIVEVSDAFDYAILEPGVTQAALAAHLEERHPTLTFNLTGSFAFTSIVGNVLERGDGAHARVDDLLGVCGVLGAGTPFEVGGIWERVGSGEPSHYSRYTAGPDLVGLFAQSSFAIVTRMAFRLSRKPERCNLFWGVARDAELERVFDAVGRLGRQGAINRGRVNVGYANRFVQAERVLRSEAGPRDGDQEVWNFYVLVPGTQRVADAVVEDLREAFAPLCLASGCFRSDSGADPFAELPPFLHPLVRPLLGTPDAESIKLIYAATGTPLPPDPQDLDPDRTPFGMKCCIPVIPPSGACARRVAEIVAKTRAHSGVDVKLSFFGDGRTLVTIHFRSDDEDQVRRAEVCEQAIWDALLDAGFPPYRASIDQMQRLVRSRPEFFALVARLESVLDPNGILAPARYSAATPRH